MGVRNGGMLREWQVPCRQTDLAHGNMQNIEQQLYVANAIVAVVRRSCLLCLFVF